MGVDVVQNCLVGKYFHSVVDGQIEWQGIVQGMPNEHVCLLRLFEWVNGEPNVMRIVPVGKMVDWLFYENFEQMDFSYNHGVARLGGKYRPRDQANRTW